MHVVIKPFRCSFDGINSVSLVAGDVKEFGSMAAGLLKAGYIGEEPASTPSADAPQAADTPAPVAGDDASTSPTAVNDPDPDTVVIPADWQSLSGNMLKSLAAKLSPDPIKTKADAVTAIEAELARRAA